MEKKSLDELAAIQGGGWLNFAEGFCFGAGIVGIGAQLGLVSITGIGVPVAIIIGIGCMGVGAYSAHERFS